MLLAMCPSKSRGAASERHWQWGPSLTGQASQTTLCRSSATLSSFLESCALVESANKVTKFHFMLKSTDKTQ